MEISINLLRNKRENFRNNIRRDSQSLIFSSNREKLLLTFRNQNETSKSEIPKLTPEILRQNLIFLSNQEILYCTEIDKSLIINTITAAKANICLLKLEEEEEIISQILNLLNKYSFYPNCKIIAYEGCLLIEEFLKNKLLKSEKINHNNEILNLVMEIHHNMRKESNLNEVIFYIFAHMTYDPLNIEILINKDLVLDILLLIDQKIIKYNLILPLTYTIYNMVTINLDKHYTTLKYLIPLILQMLEFQNEKLLACNLLSLCALLKEEPEEINEFLTNYKDSTQNMNMLDYLSKFLIVENNEIIKNCLKIIYKITVVELDNSFNLSQYQIFETMINLLDKKDSYVIKDLLFILANYIADDKKSIKNFLKFNFYEKIKNLYWENQPQSVKNEIIYCFANTTHFISEEQLPLFIKEYEIIQIFITALRYELDYNFELEIVLNSLIGIKNIFELIPNCDEPELGEIVKIIIEKMNGEKIFDALEDQKNMDISYLTNYILNLNF